MDPAHLNKLFSISNWLILIPCYCQNSIGDLWNTLVPTEEDPAPLFLAYTPFYHKSEYLTREGREVKLLKEKAQKEQEAAKTREDLLLQKQLEMEAALKRQEALIAQLMNKQA